MTFRFLIEKYGTLQIFFSHDNLCLFSEEARQHKLGFDVTNYTQTPPSMGRKSVGFSSVFLISMFSFSHLQTNFVHVIQMAPQ